ncbi:MAG: aminotransferase class V-fold PLP-dependent enzyme [Chromatiales bacterium]|jgi:selenocysteine lyase/cysteine desulfurase|nr:aminotransferase class V-fold PLP-dependent enzyme [Chromatiales bacterium]
MCTPADDVEFPLLPSLIHLNHAGVSPWPRRSADAVCAFARENQQQGSLAYPKWLRIESELRELAALLINAPHADDIALLKNTSEGLSFIAYGFPWQQGDNIVSVDQEFPSNRIVWESLATEGVELRCAAIGMTDDPEQALFDLVDERTRLLAVSSVQYASGLRLDLARIGNFCRCRGIVLCVDAIQSIGALRTDVQAIQADVVVADGHKWMLGPEGVAIFYTTPALRERLRLTQYGWHMVEHSGDFERRDWTVARSARRFECGSPNMLGIHGLHASLGLLLEVGMDEVEHRILDNTAFMSALIHESEELELLSAHAASRQSGIVVFRRRDRDSAVLHEALRLHGVQCALRGGGIRYSPHYYTERPQLSRALQLAREL